MKFTAVALAALATTGAVANIFGSGSNLGMILPFH